MTASSKYPRRAGLRFAHLIRQLEDEGWTQTAIAAAIGCHQTLISKCAYRGGDPHEYTQKGLRDDVIQGIFEGLGVRSDLLFMPRPKDYPNRIRLPSGEYRPAEPEELDHHDFRVISHAEVEAARDRKERGAMKDDIRELQKQMAETNRQVAQLVALLVRERGTGG